MKIATLVNGAGTVSRKFHSKKLKSCTYDCHTYVVESSYWIGFAKFLTVLLYRLYSSS